MGFRSIDDAAGSDVIASAVSTEVASSLPAAIQAYRPAFEQVFWQTFAGNTEYELLQAIPDQRGCLRRLHVTANKAVTIQVTQTDGTPLLSAHEVAAGVPWQPVSPSGILVYSPSGQGIKLAISDGTADVACDYFAEWVSP